MAANNHAMRAMYARLGLSNPVSVAITDLQRLNSIEDLRNFREADVDTLAKTLQKPGGTIPDPANPGANIPNPGFYIPVRAITNLKLAVFYIKYRHLTSRQTTPADIDTTDASIFSVKDLWEEQQDKKADPALPPSSTIFDTKNWTKTFKSLTELLRSRKGRTTGLPLAWVVRKDETISDDPNPNAEDHGWISVTEEMIYRAPMKTAAGAWTSEFKTDNVKVWEIINELTRDLPCNTTIKPTSKAQDGRKAFYLLESQFLGSHQYVNQANEAERLLSTTYYDGETRRANFDTYTNIHQQQHAIIEGLVEHGAHMGLNETMKTRHFINNIRCADLKLAVTNAWTNDDINSDFTKCVAYFRDQLTKLGTLGNFKHSMQVASVQTSNDAHTIDVDQVVDKFYSYEEYRRLTPAAKKKLHSLREKSDKNGKKRKNGSNNGSRKRRKKSNVSSASTQPDQPSEASNNGDASTNNTSSGNRNNPALTRQQSSRQR